MRATGSTRIAILYICTGKYTVFWKEFYETFEKNFLRASEKTYFVFTDSKKLPYATEKNVCLIPQKNLGWPDNTLQRFAMFVREEERFKDYDYTFFMNANMLCLEEVTEEDFLPIKEDILVAVDAIAYGKNPDDFTYDRNPLSKAYIPFGEGKYYVMGGLNGGKTAPYMKMVHELKDNVDEDTKNGVMAIWHDESHLNRYIIGREDLKILPPCYGGIEEWDLPYEQVMLFRDKSRYFDVEAVKAGNFVGRLKLHLGRLKSKIAIRKRISGLLHLFKRKK